MRNTTIAFALAILASASLAYAAGPRAVEGAEPPSDAAENCPPDMSLPSGTKLTFQCGPTGFAHSVTVEDHGKFSVFYCKQGKVPLKDCGGSIGGFGWSPGNLAGNYGGGAYGGAYSGGTIADVLAIGAVDPFSAAVLAATDLPPGQAWAGTIDGTGGPVTSVPGYDPWETPQAAAARIARCQSICTEAFGNASASCGLLGAYIGGRAGAYAAGFCTLGGAGGAAICRSYC